MGHLICEKCGVLLQEDTANEATYGELFCPKCGLVYQNDALLLQKRIYEARQTAPLRMETGQPGTDGTPQMNVSIIKDKNGNKRVAGALFLERWKKHHGPRGH